MKFGDIYTNGNNFWMVTWVSSKPKCSCECHRYELDKHSLRRVVLDADGNPNYLVGYNDVRLADIHPYAELVTSATWSPSTPKGE